LTKQDNWNQVALAKVASTHKFTDFLKSRDLRMLSKSCSLVAVDTYEQYFTSLSGAILLYLSAKITEKYVKEHYVITEQKEIDKIRLGLVHCFGLPKQQNRKRKLMVDVDQSESNQVSQPVSNTPTKSNTNRSTTRLFFMVPEKVLEDIRSQFSFADSITRNEYLCCIGWLIARPAKKIHKEMRKKYPNIDPPSPFADYDKELAELCIANNAILSFHPQNAPSIQNHASSITNFNFL